MELNKRRRKWLHPSGVEVGWKRTTTTTAILTTSLRLSNSRRQTGADMAPDGDCPISRQRVVAAAAAADEMRRWSVRWSGHRQMTSDGSGTRMLRCAAGIVRSSSWLNASRNPTCRLLDVIALLTAYTAQFCFLMMPDFNLLQFLQKACNVVFNPLVGTGNYNATSKNMKLVHWPLMGAVTFGTARRGLGGGRVPPIPHLAAPNVTAHLSAANVLITCAVHV